MYLTVSEALSVYPLSESRLVAGAGGLPQIIKAINIMDAPDIADWLKPGEMLFTTGFLVDKEEGLTTFIRKLKSRGCVGLGIKLGRYWQEISPDVLDVANELDFPLLLLPFAYTFSDQMNALFQAEYEKNTKVLQTILGKQKRLMRYALQKDPVEDAFLELSDILGYPMAIVSVRGHLFYNSSAWRTEQLLAGFPWKHVHHAVQTKQGACYRVPLLQDDQCYGFLLVMHTSSVVHKMEEGLFHQAAEILCEQLSRHAVDMIGHAVRHELGHMMRQYLQGDVPIQPLMQSAKEKGLAFLEHPYICTLLQYQGEPGERGGVKARMRQISQELHYNPKLNEFDVQYFHLDEGILAIYSCVDDKLAGFGRRLQIYLQGATRELLSANERSHLQIVMSRLKLEGAFLLDAYRECTEVIALARRLHIQERVIWFEHMEFAYVFQHIPEEVMRKYCDKFLHPLLVKDEEYRAEMLQTLRVYMENDGQINQTAASLHIHRNTVAYRLDRISDMLQIDFKVYDDLLKLKMVLLFQGITKSS